MKQACPDWPALQLFDVCVYRENNALQLSEQNCVIDV